MSSENCVNDRYSGASGSNSYKGKGASGNNAASVSTGSPTAKQNFDAIRYGNSHGSIAFGKIDEKGTVTSSVLLQGADGRHHIAMDKDGQRQGWTTLMSPGVCQISCGHDNAPEADSCFIDTKNGNIRFVATNGKIILQGLDVEIIASGSGSTGNFRVNANENISFDAPKFLVNAKDSYKIATSGTGEVVANGILKMYGSLIQGVTDACAIKDSKNNHQPYQIKNNLP